MYITYHKELTRPKKVNSFIPHQCLNEDIQKFIKEHNCQQVDGYYVDNNGFYFFIYLDNGDRIDVKLN